MEKRRYPIKKTARPPQADMAFGVQSVLETLRSGKEVERVLIQRELGMSEVQKLATERQVPVQRVPVEKLNRLTGKNHQGVICFVSPIHYAPLHNVLAETFDRGETPLFLVLDRITDVRNFGAICRTAECAGAQGIVVPQRGGAQINADAMKTSSGALNYLPISREEKLYETVRYMKDSGLQLIACTEKADTPLYALDMSLPTAILMGSEEDGISPELLRLADHKVRIPLMGKVESLNVAAATAVILYEAVRQRTDG